MDLFLIHSFLLLHHIVLLGLLLLDHHEVLSGRVFDLAGTLRVFKRIESLLIVGIKLADAGKHDCLCIPTKRVFQEASQLAISVANETAAHRAIRGLLLRFQLTQCIYAVSKGQQALVDVRAFYKALPAIVGGLCSLRAGQVHQLQLGDGGGSLSIFSDDVEDENSVRARAHLVRPSCRHSSSFISNLDYVLEVCDASDPILTQVLHYDTLRRVFKYGQILLLLIRRLLSPVSAYPTEQVLHLLVVDLQEAHTNCRFAATVASFVRIWFKKLLHRQICDSCFCGIRTARAVPNDASAEHCMSLSCPGHTIREAGGIVSLFELG